MEYNVRITETRVMVVPVEAENMSAAKLAAEKNWRNQEYENNKSFSKNLTFETLYPDHDSLDTRFTPMIAFGESKATIGIAAEPTRKPRRYEPGR